MIKARIYGVTDCPYCNKALHFLQSEGIPVEVISYDGDQVILAGVKAVIQQDAPLWPILLSPMTKKVIVGWNQEEYEQLADAYNRERRRRALDFDSANLGTAGAAPENPQQGSVAQETAGMPAVPGLVGGNGNVSDGSLVPASS